MYSSEEFLAKLAQQRIEVGRLSSQSGGNSLLYNFRINDDEFILKVYLGEKDRICTSRERERNAYIFLHSNNFHKLPRIIEEINISNGICLEFVKGKRPKWNRRTNLEIQESCLKLKNIFEKNQTFDNAIDSTFSSHDILDQLESRLENLKKKSNPESIDLLKTFDKLRRREQIEFPTSGLTYSLSDIGAHNMIKNQNKFYHIDLEFFGRDSAVKMFIDYLLHPQNEMSSQNRIQTIRFATKHFGLDLDLIVSAVPFFAAKWATIVARRMYLMYAQQDIKLLRKTFREYIEIASLNSNSEIYSKLKSSR